MVSLLFFLAFFSGSWYGAGVGVKTGRSWVGGPDLCVKADGIKK